MEKTAIATCEENSPANSARRRNAKLGGRRSKVSLFDLETIFNRRADWTSGRFQHQIFAKTGIRLDRSNAYRQLKKLEQKYGRILDLIESTAEDVMKLLLPVR